MKLQHGPMTKQQIKDVLHDLLYEPGQASRRKKLKAIIMKNCQIQKGGHPSLIYRGEVYISEDCTTRPPPQILQLAPQLKPEMDTYLKEIADLDANELPYVLGFITQVLNSSDGLQDYLRVLPESVHRPIQQIIDSCPCRASKLEDEEVEAIKERNAVPIQLLKQRLMLNLLL